MKIDLLKYYQRIAIEKLMSLVILVNSLTHSIYGCDVHNALAGDVSGYTLQSVCEFKKFQFMLFLDVKKSMLEINYRLCYNFCQQSFLSSTENLIWPGPKSSLCIKFIAWLNASRNIGKSETFWKSFLSVVKVWDFISYPILSEFMKCF